MAGKGSLNNPGGPLSSGEDVQNEEPKMTQCGDDEIVFSASSVAKSAVSGSEEEGNGIMEAFGVLRDGLLAAQPAVDTGFRAAKAGTELGFEISKQVVHANFHLANSMIFGDAQPGEVSPVRSSVEGVIDLAHGITRASMDFSHEVTRASLDASDKALELAGAKQGQVVKSLTAYVERQRGKDGGFLDFHTKEALLGLAVLLGNLNTELKVKNPLKLMAGARALAEVQANHRKERREKRRSKMLSAAEWPTSRELEEWQVFVHFSAAAYGYQALRFLGITAPSKGRFSLTSDKEAIEALTGVSREDIALLHCDGEIYRPGHYVAVSRIHQKVVIAIRGTMRPQDALVDLVCEQTEFVSPFDSGDEVIEGSAHRGFLKSAQRLAGDLHEIVVQLLDENPGYELVVTGHSYGAAVATILTLMWSRMPVFRSRNIRAFAFAAPCSVCHRICRAPYTKRHVTSVILKDDIVARLSLSSFRDLQKAMIALAPSGTVPLSEKAQIYKQLERADPEEKLFSAGRVWMLKSEEFDGAPVVEVDPVDVLGSIELAPSIFSVHLPNEYLNAVNELRHESLLRSQLE